MLTRRHGSAVQFGERCRERRQRLGQALPFKHATAHRQQHALDPRRSGLRGGSTQGLLDRQGGLDQRRQLAGQQGQLGGRQAATQAQAVTRLLVLAGPRRADLQRRQLSLAQQGTRLAGAVGFQQALVLTTLGIQRQVGIGGHGSGLALAGRR